MSSNPSLRPAGPTGAAEGVQGSRRQSPPIWPEVTPEAPPEAPVPEVSTPITPIRIWGRVRKLAHAGSSRARLAAAWLGGNPVAMPEPARRAYKKLYQTAEELRSKERRWLAALGATAVGLAAVMVANPKAAALLAAPARAGGLLDIDTDAATPPDITDSGTPHVEMPLASIDEPADTDTLAAETNYTMPQDVETGKIGAEAAEHQNAAHDLPPAPDLADSFADQLGLLEKDDGTWETPGLEKFQAEPKEGDLFKPGTGYNTLEEIARNAGLTTEQIQELDESGEWHDLVRKMLHDSGVTYESEAHEYPDYKLDTQLPEGFRFTISDDLLEKLYDANPPEVSADGLAEELGLSGEQINAIDGDVANWNQDKLNQLYHGTDIQAPPANDIHGLKDLPMPDTLAQRQQFLENLRALLADSIGEAKDATDSEEDDGDGIHPALIAGGAVAGVGIGAGAAALLARRRGDRQRQAHQQELKAQQEAMQTSLERALERERQRWEWIDDNTPINFDLLHNTGRRGRGYRNAVRRRVLNEAQLTGMTSRRQVIRELDRWIQFTLGNEAPNEDERTALLERLYGGLVNNAGTPLHDPTAPIGRLSVPVERYGPGNSFARIEPDFAVELRRLMSNMNVRSAYEDHLRGLGIALNGGFWRMIDSGQIRMSDLLIALRQPGGFIEATRT